MRRRPAPQYVSFLYRSRQTPAFNPWRLGLNITCALLLCHKEVFSDSRLFWLSCAWKLNKLINRKKKKKEMKLRLVRYTRGRVQWFGTHLLLDDAFRFSFLSWKSGLVRFMRGVLFFDYTINGLCFASHGPKKNQILGEKRQK